MLLIKKYSFPGTFVFQIKLIIPIIDKFQVDGFKQKDVESRENCASFNRHDFIRYHGCVLVLHKNHTH